MNAFENYKKILENIFGAIPKLKSNKPISNNCIGALNNPDNFGTFRENFISRVERLSKYFSCESETKELIEKLCSIANVEGFKWSGPYSELVALDYFSQLNEKDNFKFVDKGLVDNYGESIAKKVGKNEIDFDISFEFQCTQIFMDIKSLIPTHIELIEQVYSLLKEKVSEKKFLIGIEEFSISSSLDICNDFAYERTHEGLIENLTTSINNNEVSCSYQFKSGKSINFKISYENVDRHHFSLMTNKFKNPYSTANDYKYKILNCWNKLLFEKPSFITYIIQPWFNEEINDFCSFNKIFYRSLSRRIFMELSKDNGDAGEIVSKLKGKGIKVCDIANCVSGLIFIEDNSINCVDEKLYNAYIFTNPNAVNTPTLGYNFEGLTWPNHSMKPEVDDFKYDNY